MRKLKPGLRLRSAVCDTEILVIKPPSGEVDIGCGGAPMLAAGEAMADAALSEAHSAGTQIGKRYVDEAASMEVLCTKGGTGSLTVNGTPMRPRESKPLPSSD